MAKKAKKYREQKATERGYKRFLNTLKRKDKPFVVIVEPVETIRKSTNVYKNNTCIIDEFDLSPTLRLLFENNKSFSTEKPGIPKNGILYVPKIFSLSEYPNESFKFLKDLLFTLRFPRNEKLIINYKYCERIDLDASICNDIILSEYIKAFNNCNSKKIILQTKSIKAEEIKSENVRKFLNATGTHKIIKGLKSNYPGIVTFDLAIGDKRRGISHKEVESTKLVLHIDKCLSKMNKRLSSDAKESFGEIIGEVMANAEEHNITDYHYSIGHFEESNKYGKHIGTFQLVIFNFGESIYERFNNPNACKNKEILVDMSSLSEKYKKKGLFGFLDGKRFEEEMLWTLYSLQDGVSSVDKTRGNGTIRFIERFLELDDKNHDNNSVLYLYSGNTRIKFDGTYKTIPKSMLDDEEFKIIPFNLSGSLDEKPDQKYVTFVENFFPGTMIYANICIKKDDIIENEHSED